MTDEPAPKVQIPMIGTDILMDMEKFAGIVSYLHDNMVEGASLTVILNVPGTQRVHVAFGSYQPGMLWQVESLIHGFTTGEISAADKGDLN